MFRYCKHYPSKIVADFIFCVIDFDRSTRCIVYIFVLWIALKIKLFLNSSDPVLSSSSLLLCSVSAHSFITFSKKKESFKKMRLSGKLLSQLRFNVEKHFIQNPKVKSYPMEALGYKG